MTRSLRCATLVCLATCWPGAAHATKFWKNSVPSGNWSTSNNWSAVSAAGADNGGVPVVNEQVRIVNIDGVARTVTLDTNPPALGLVSIDLTGAGSTTNTLSLTTNNNLTGAAIFVGGHNGVAPTNGRGTITQTAGTISTSPGLDWAIGHGAGSTGTYNLSGTGAVIATQSQYIGFNGTGVFNHSGGTNTINAGAIGAFDVGVFAGALGTYNLSGTGQLISNKSEYVGDQGTGVFNHTGGTNTIGGVEDLYLGFSASGVGTYTISGTAALTVGDDLIVGQAGTGTLNVQGQSSVHVNDTLSIGAGDAVNLSGGTLRFNGYSRNATGAFNFTAGTMRLAGNRILEFETAFADAYGASQTISNGRNLTVEGRATFNASGGTVNVGNAALTALGELVVGLDNVGVGTTLNITSGGVVTSNGATLGKNALSPSSFAQGTVNVNGGAWTTGDIVVGDKGRGTLNITNGGTVVSSSVLIGIGVDAPASKAVVSGTGATWTANSIHLDNGALASQVLEVRTGGLVYLATNLRISDNCRVNLDGGTLRLNSITPGDESRLLFNSGTIQLAGDRNIGTDGIVKGLYGVLPVIPTGKGLTVEGTAELAAALRLDGGTLKALTLNVTTGSLDFDGGVLEVAGSITGLSSLVVPTGGEFRASGVQSLRVIGAAGSTISAMGNLTLGVATAVNGFGAQGTVAVGANTVTLLDANTAVFDSLSLVTLGSGANPGTLSAANGVTLDFGGNITGFGAVSTPNTIAKPLVNNGAITGASASDRITLSGYVKGVGTFDNVDFTGAFSPGLSPTSLQVGSIFLSNSSTLVMEIGGTSPGSGYDQLQASGVLAFDGVLEVQLLGGFTPTAGQSFNLFDWNSISGTFDLLLLPTLTGGLSWNTSQLYTTGILSLVSAGIPGDYNSNGSVDAADYTAYRDALGTNATLPNDTTPGSVTAADYAVWQANFDAGGPSAASAVPEPAAVLLLIAGWLMVIGVAIRQSSSRLHFR